MSKTKSPAHLSFEEPPRMAWGVDTLIIAGWAGRDRAAVEAHIRELEALGVPRPRQTPMFYEVAPGNLTFDDTIAVVGNASSGEVECVLGRDANGLWLGVGSDHTDRRLEAHGVTYSKQLCPKPICPNRWRWDDVVGHYDALVLRSWATIEGQRHLYQEGSVTALRHPLDLAQARWAGEAPPVGAAMFCGTLTVHGEIRFADRFDFELEDPLLGRKLTHGYSAAALEIVD